MPLALHMHGICKHAAGVAFAALLSMQLCSSLQYAGMWGLSNGTAVTGPTKDAVHDWTSLTFEVSEPAAITANAAVALAVSFAPCAKDFAAAFKTARQKRKN